MIRFISRNLSALTDSGETTSRDELNSNGGEQVQKCHFFKTGGKIDEISIFLIRLFGSTKNSKKKKK